MLVHTYTCKHVIGACAHTHTRTHTHRERENGMEYDTVNVLNYFSPPKQLRFFLSSLNLHVNLQILDFTH